MSDIKLKWPGEKQPEEGEDWSIGSAVSKGLEYAGFPFAWLGQESYKVMHPSEWGSANIVGGWGIKSPFITKEKQSIGEQFGEIMPGGEKYEEYKKKPLLEQLVWESPAFLFGGGVPTTLKSAGAMPKAGEMLAGTKTLFGLSEAPVQAITKKQAERLLANQLARGEEPAKELIAKVAPKIIKTEELTEATLSNPLAGKLKGSLDYALKTQRQTARLYKQQRAIKAGRLSQVFKEEKGVESYKDALRTLKGKLEKGEFEMPPEFQFTKGDADAILNTIYRKNLGSFETVNASRAIMKLSGLIRDEAGLPSQLVKSEIKLLGDVFPELRSTVALYQSWGAKAWDVFIDAANIPRAMLASGDLSVTFRQLALAVSRKPQLLPRVMKVQLQTLFSPKNWKAINEAGLSNPDVQLFVEKGMYRAPEPGKTIARLWAREEQFQSNLAERIPVVGKFIKASERAFTAGANAMRDGMAKDYANLLRKKNLLNDENVEGLAQVINWATGRGSFPSKIQNTSPVLNAFFFAPRYVLSRIYDTPRLLASKNPIVRQEAWRTAFQFLGAGASILGLAKLSGADVEFNPLSSDVGKIKVGNTRLDIWAGFIQYYRFAAQLTMGKREITGTKEEQELDRLQVIWRMLQSKGSPIFGLFVDLLSGETYTGEPMYEGGLETVGREARNRLLFLVAQDIYEAIKSNGLVGGLVAIPATLGVGVVSYENKGEGAGPYAPSGSSPYGGEGSPYGGGSSPYGP
jgi:hypothetical protein